MKTRRSLRQQQASEKKLTDILSNELGQENLTPQSNSKTAKKSKNPRVNYKKSLQTLSDKSKSIRKRATNKKKRAPATNDAVVHRKKTFTCEICQRHIGTKGGLKYHINAHLFGRPFKCDVCKKTFATKNDLTTHKKIHTERSTCEFCKKNFTTKHNVADHIAAVHLQKQLPCVWCKRLYATKSILNRHMHLVHPTQAFQKPPRAKKEKFKCDICKAMFYKLSYTKHVQLRAKMRYECSYCHQKFPCYDLHRQHRVAEEKSFDHKCPICKRHVTNSVHQHITNQHGEYHCDICPFFCENITDIIFHKKMCGTDEQIKAMNHKCSICKLIFRTRRLMLMHKNNDHDCPFKCLQCPAQYWLKDSFEEHKERHKVRKIRCLVCKKLLFSTMEKFNVHFRGHYSNGKEGRLCCNYCRQTFNLKIKLQNHIVQKHCHQFRIQ